MDSNTPGTPVPPRAPKLPPVFRQRLEKVDKLRSMGVEPWPWTWERSHRVSQLLEDSDGFVTRETEVRLAGRLMAWRRMGGASFAQLEDFSGKIQLFIQRETVGADSFDIIKLFDIGDIVGVRGTAFVTKTGEFTLNVVEATLLAKNVHPLPAVKEKDGQVFDEYSDKEARYRQRYIDLLVNPGVRETFVQRTRIISLIRHFLEERDYFEVETPILQPVYGGAAARPFVTHHNSLDMKLYLRIANELYLKRLIVGGFERVFEFAHDFRNEGIDRFHNPEFTMIELYCAYKDYHYMMDLVEELVSSLAEKLLGHTEVDWNGHRIQLKAPWRRATMMDLIQEATGQDLLGAPRAVLEEAARKAGVEVLASHSDSTLLDGIFGEKVEPFLIQPTFVMDHPVEMSPLAKRHRHDARLTERFEAVVGGKELCNAFTELSDPFDQKSRFVEQNELIARGDLDAQPYDEDFIKALEVGMPPTAGLGIGIDRLVMLLTGQDSIRDVIFFPTLRPEGGARKSKDNKRS
ncbi:MAG: lysine--tRNA ligase [Calditrichaeota bacterium]|nr:lysine--tRNA ligase [Candidatus Cloacimonadota bacterium]MCA9787007.1 lysine--tRNA ligase [Candidatus Cloacimonadota bacterium]MCB1046114.1 lysine--tRNA ligase [Calditrichota bacterium]MCB9473366.1 lysine--tRNA ligase [Candidatus Delongbacteria bacterium]